MCASLTTLRGQGKMRLRSLPQEGPHHAGPTSLFGERFTLARDVTKARRAVHGSRVQP